MFAARSTLPTRLPYHGSPGRSGGTDKASFVPCSHGRFFGFGFSGSSGFGTRKPRASIRLSRYRSAEIAWLSRPFTTEAQRTQRR